MAATNSLGAEQTLCRAFHSVVCFSRAETLAYANFSFAGATLYRLYRLSLPPSDASDDNDEGPPSPYVQLFPALTSCRREIFDDLDQYGMAIDPSLCDYGRKNETAIREVDRLTVDDASRLVRRIDDTVREHDLTCRRSLTIAVAVIGATGLYTVLTHLIRCIWITVERRQRGKSPLPSRRKQHRLEPDRELAIQRPTSNDEETAHREHNAQCYDGWSRCNGEASAKTDKTEMSTLLASDERMLSARCMSEDDTSDRKAKILSVTNCFQTAQISV